MTIFQEHNIIVSIPVSMNFCKGVDTCKDFLMMVEQEIVEEMVEQEVIDARHIARLTDDKRKKTATVILTFGKSSLPEKIYV